MQRFFRPSILFEGKNIKRPQLPNEYLHLFIWIEQFIHTSECLSIFHSGVFQVTTINLYDIFTPNVATMLPVQCIRRFHFYRRLCVAFPVLRPLFVTFAIKPRLFRTSFSSNIFSTGRIKKPSRIRVYGLISPRDERSRLALGPDDIPGTALKRFESDQCLCFVILESRLTSNKTNLSSGQQTTRLLSDRNLDIASFQKKFYLVSNWGFPAHLRVQYIYFCHSSFAFSYMISISPRIFKWS